VKTSDFDYYLPQELIAQTPVEPRDRSRLMVLNRADGKIEHRSFSELLSYLHAGDVLIFNDSRVIPARLIGHKVDTGGRVEILLLRRSGNNTWETLVKPGKRINIGTRIEITDESVSDGHRSRVLAEIVGLMPGGVKLVGFSDESLLPGLGVVPLPPYIHVPLANPARYQTVYAETTGSVAAPTAGLHFTPKLLNEIAQKGIRCLFVTLHIGLDTFRQIKEEEPKKHPIWQEYGLLSQQVATQLCQAKREGRRIICVGTSTVRLIEHVAELNRVSLLAPFEGWVNLFILPGYEFRMVDAIITNFHLPCSTLLMLVSTFTGWDLTKCAYDRAIASGYRFYSFGDAMLII
jgi:S-adenosylmethionine:tRNA ribosyltransferase-isomerase